MRRKILTAICLLLPLMMQAQIAIGMRDSKYVNVTYTTKSSLGIGLEHSVFSQEIETQYIRGMLSYASSFRNFGCKANLYYGTPYDGAYYNCGMMLSANYGVNKTITLMASLNPHYDSYYEYKTCYNAGVSLQLCNEIKAWVMYSTIPEFRQDEKRIKAGLDFTVQNLSVSPFLSIPVEGKVKSCRLLVNAKYSFKTK